MLEEPLWGLRPLCFTFPSMLTKIEINKCTLFVQFNLDSLQFNLPVLYFIQNHFYRILWATKDNIKTYKNDLISSHWQKNVKTSSALKLLLVTYIFPLCYVHTTF